MNITPESSSINRVARSILVPFYKSANIPLWTLIILGITIIISLIFIIVQNYTDSTTAVWYCLTTYINIIMITICLILYVLYCKYKNTTIDNQ